MDTRRPSPTITYSRRLDSLQYAWLQLMPRDLLRHLSESGFRVGVCLICLLLHPSVTHAQRFNFHFKNEPGWTRRFHEQAVMLNMTKQNFYTVACSSDTLSGDCSMKWNCWRANRSTEVRRHASGNTVEMVWTCTPCPKKWCHYIFVSYFAKCWPIFKILSQTDLAVNVQQSDNKISHHASDMSLRYLVKY